MMGWLRRRPQNPSGFDTEMARIAVRHLRELEDQCPADSPSRSVVPAAAPVEAAPASPAPPTGSQGRGGLSFSHVDGEVVGPDHVVTCGCGRVAPCRHCPLTVPVGAGNE